MPRKYKYIVMHCLPKISDEWTPIEEYLGQAEHTFKKDADAECKALQSIAWVPNVKYRVDRVENESPNPSGRAPRKRGRCCSPSATRKSGTVRGLDGGPGRPRPLPAIARI